MTIKWTCNLVATNLKLSGYKNVGWRDTDPPMQKIVYL